MRSEEQLKVILILLLTLVSVLGMAQEWKLHENSDGVAVYTRKVDGIPIKDVRINTTLKTSLKEMIAALEDFELQENWIKNTKHSKKLEQISPEHFYFYIATDFPFPAKDRDAIIEYKRIQDPVTKVIEIDYKAFPDRLPDYSSYVRMPALSASYILTPIADKEIAVEYYIRADIGGKIPNWIINMAISVGPRDTMLALRDVLAKGRYAGVEVEGVVD